MSGHHRTRTHLDLAHASELAKSNAANLDASKREIQAAPAHRPARLAPDEIDRQHAHMLLHDLARDPSDERQELL